DRELVEREIVNYLQSQGINPWFSDRDIVLGDSWNDRLSDGLESCEWFLVALSPHAVASKWVKFEVHWAITNKKAGRILPIVLQACDTSSLHWTLPLIQQVNLLENPDRA